MIDVGLRAAIFGCVLAAAAPTHAHADATARAFESMKAAVGIWRPADSPGSPLRIRFSVTAGGTVLVEEWTRNGQPHSLTLYHRDGAGLIATHYCPQGNQPRLAMVPQTDRGIIRFKFKDATDLDPAHESHAVELAFNISNPARLVRHEAYRFRDTDEVSELPLVREP